MFNSCGRANCCQDDFAQYTGFDKYAGSLPLRAEEPAVAAVEATEGETAVSAKDAVAANFVMISDATELGDDIASQYFPAGIEKGTVVLKLTEDVVPVAPEVVPEEESKDAVAAAPKEEESKDTATKPEETEKEEQKPKVDMEKAEELPAKFKAGTIIVALNSQKTNNAWQFLPKGKEAYFVQRAAAATSFVVVPIVEASATKSHAQDVTETPATTTTDGEQKEGETTPDDGANKPADWTMYYIIFGVIGVAVVAGIVYFMLFAGGDAEGDETEEEEVSEEDDEQV
jgi:hypothetical protein